MREVLDKKPEVPLSLGEYNHVLYMFQTIRGWIVATSSVYIGKRRVPVCNDKCTPENCVSEFQNIDVWAPMTIGVYSADQLATGPGGLAFPEVN